ncbi:MAG: Fis family transcriptional regulator [Thermoprotei archaeon]|nr:MAG: Fis family transcriptional regulator [Thermoprotei archaeon]RLF20413.1 MAG: Fis family transcriptional regulator [Thermoprotei archaeon]
MAFLIDRRFYDALLAKIRRRPLCLSHLRDVDGIVSAALFVIKNPNSVVILANPHEVVKGWFSLFTWDFVADLPCPKKAIVRVDHHKSNPPGAVKEYYDPEAPCAALLVMKALGLEDDEKVKKLVEMAIEADTANITSDETWDLNDAIKAASYREKIRLVKGLAEKGIEVLKEEWVKKLIMKNRKKREITLKVCDLIRIEEETLVLIDKGVELSYRGLCIELERRGAKFTCVMVPLRRGKYRLYLGASKDSEYDVAELARSLGGGGHRFAAGAIARNLDEALLVIANYLRKDELNIAKITRSLTVEYMQWRRKV